MQIKGKNVLLTGGSRGVGPYIARALALEGANIALVARNALQLESVAREVAALGVRCIALAGDIAVRSDRQIVVERAIREFGRIDILINNAAIGRWVNFHEQEDTDITRIIDTNLLAPMFLTRSVLPGMLERKQGHIINISSLAGKRGVPFEATYGGSKGGLIQWSNALRLELEGTGVRVSVVFPVYISEVGMFAAEGLPAPRMAGSVTPESVGRAVVQALRTGKGEVIVRKGLTRVLYSLNELSPGLGDWMLKTYGVVALSKRIVGSNHKQPLAQ